MRTPPLAAATAVLLSSALASQTPYKVGKPLPDLRLPTIAGDRTVHLADYRGKRLLLIEFAAW